MIRHLRQFLVAFLALTSFGPLLAVEVYLSGELLVAPSPAVLNETLTASLSVNPTVLPLRVGEQQFVSWENGPSYVCVWSAGFSEATPNEASGQRQATGSYATAGDHELSVTVTLTGTLRYQNDQEPEPWLIPVNATGTYSQTITVADQVLRLAGKRATQSTWRYDSVSVLAGGLTSAIHQANIKVEFSPPLTESQTMTLRLLPGAGEGYQPTSQQWWWPRSRKRAAVTLSGQTYTAGDQNQSPAIIALSFTVPAGTADWEGTLISSNLVESVTIEARLLGTNQTATLPMSFALPNPTVTLGEGAPDEDGWKSFSVSCDFEGEAVTDHTLYGVVSAVILADGGHWELSAAGSEQSQETAVDYIYLDGPLLEKRYAILSLDVTGTSTGKYKYISQDALSFTLTLTDLDITAKE